jgi:hypothetical protein
MPDIATKALAKQTPSITLADIHVKPAESVDPVQELICVPDTIRAMRELLVILSRFKKLDFFSDVTWYLHALIRAIHRSGGRYAKLAYPCPACNHPVAALRLLDDPEVFIVAACEDPDPKVPQPFRWHVDIFEEHACAGDEIQ